MHASSSSSDRMDISPSNSMESVHSTEGPPVLNAMKGSVPGVCDPTQPARLLRFAKSKLFFASFDPLTARGAGDPSGFRNLSINETRYRPKRIVVEICPNGDTSWRFVPKARLERGVPDEGTWPRIVQIEGDLRELCQDQWDIHKLDPEYDCSISLSPVVASIRRIPPQPAQGSSPKPFSKRRFRTPSPERKRSSRSKKKGASVEDCYEGDEEYEVEAMVVDDPPPSRGRPRKTRESSRQRRSRRENLAGAGRDRGLEEEKTDVSMAGPSPPPQPKPMRPEISTKRKISDLSSGFRQPDEPDSPQKADGSTVDSSPRKRTRKVSPASARRDLDEKRWERERRKKERWEQALDGRKQMRDQQLMEDVLKEVPDLDAFTNFGQEDEPDEEALREAAIAESRRKLAELEADRPLWEEAARKRVAQEQAEEELRRAKAEKRRRETESQAEAERKARVEKEEREDRRHEEGVRRNRARRETERRRQRQRWSCGVWTTERALERYKALCETFDETKFTRDDPLSFEDVPWPVLHSPFSLSVEDIDWTAVETFFEAVKPQMGEGEYKAFVQSSHRRFHPDRWKARGLLKSISDETERGCLEVASNSVTQALTPVWRELRNQSLI